MHLLGKFRISVTDAKRPVMGVKLPEAIAAALAVPADQRTPEQAAAIAAHYRSLDAELARLTAEAGKAADAAKNARQIGVQDLAWALINSPAFLFNR
jgi:3-methyladenine DNA glycosylase/8-oxoguanine DNA glycosylase